MLDMLDVFMPQVSIYLNETNLNKLDLVRGHFIKRSTAINEVLNVLDEEWLKSLLK